MKVFIKRKKKLVINLLVAKISIMTGFMCLMTFLLFTPVEARASNINDNTGDKGRVICSYELLDKGIIPGESFNVKLTFENVGSKSALSSILINYTNSINSFFSTDENSGQIYISELKPNNPYEVTLELHASESIQTNTVPFELLIVYADSESSTNKSSIVMQFPINLRSYLKVNAVSVSNHIVKGEKVRMRVTYQNAGAKDLYNIKMNVKGDHIQEVLPASLGKLSIGKTNYVDIYVIFTEEKSQTIIIELTYEDVQGTLYTAEDYEVKAEVMAYSLDNSDAQEVFNDNNIEVSVTQKYLLEIKIALLSGIVLSGAFMIVLIIRYYKTFQ